MKPTPLRANQPMGPEPTPPPADQSAQVDQRGQTGQTTGPVEQRDDPTRVQPAPGAQRTEGEGHTPTHTHPALTHTHDHYHVTHHRRGGVLGVGEWEHRTHWHTHAHDHAALTHSHDHSREEEEQGHGKEAHIHDHTNPTHMQA